MRGPTAIPRSIAFFSATSMKSLSPAERTVVNPACKVSRAFSAPFNAASAGPSKRLSVNLWWCGPPIDRCTCMSKSPGSSVRSPSSIQRAPAGTATAPRGPAARMWPSATTTTPSSIMRPLRTSSRRLAWRTVSSPQAGPAARSARPARRETSDTSRRQARDADRKIISLLPFRFRQHLGVRVERQALRALGEGQREALLGLIAHHPPPLGATVRVLDGDRHGHPEPDRDVALADLEGGHVVALGVGGRGHFVAPAIGGDAHAVHPLVEEPRPVAGDVAGEDGLEVAGGGRLAAVGVE